jgi:hypothetical protein
MATLTITTTDGTTHTYTGLELESAQREVQTLRKAHAERTWWRSPNATATEHFAAGTIISTRLVEVDA